MRAVLDTNEYVSALVFGGLPREILQRAERGDFELVVSAHIRDEIERVLSDKFDWSIERVAHRGMRPTIGFLNARLKVEHK